ncbi:Uncharacterised protein [Bordetella pertussis]|nr:Uncharacterised protein [Bordetella pertussis]
MICEARIFTSSSRLCSRPQSLTYDCRAISACMVRGATV